VCVGGGWGEGCVCGVRADILPQVAAQWTQSHIV